MLLLLAFAAAAPIKAAPVAPPACIVMNAQRMPLDKRASKMDSLSFSVGKTEVKVCYGAPQLKGRKMIGGEAVPLGKLWRTGANEPTMIHTTGMIMIGNVMVPAGSYSLYTVPGEKSWDVIVNKSITQWGHESTYTPEVKAQEVGHSTVKVEALTAPTERLTFTSASKGDHTAELVLSWDHAKVTIPVMAH